MKLKTKMRTIFGYRVSIKFSKVPLSTQDRLYCSHRRCAIKPQTEAQSETKTRLSKLLAQRGYCSRREADRWIQEGHVRVDGSVVDVLGSRVAEDAIIEISEAAQKEQDKHISIVLNKPLGYACSPNRDGYPLAQSLLGKLGERDELAVAGRLDINSRGLVVFTTDGRVARQVIQPDSAVEKEYIVRVRGQLTESKIEQLRFGLSLDGKPLKRAQVQKKDGNTLLFILREGKKRQIRRMCEAVDLRVSYLKRVRIGKVQLAGLPEGQWRRIDAGSL